MLTSQWQSALIEELVVPSCRVLHRHDNFSCATDEVHSTAHALNHLAWDDPVEITVLHLLVMFVLPRIKSLEIVPSKSDRVL